MYIEKGTFTIDDFVTVELEGNYEKSLMTNEQYVYNPAIPDDRNIPNQAVCVKANVLYRTDTENLSKLIKVIMRYTHDPCDDLDLDKSVESSEVMLGGTICPRKRVLFVYKSKAFVTFGRYIFGYDRHHVTIHRVGAVSDTSGDGDDDTCSKKSDSIEVNDDCDDSWSTIYSDEIRLDDKITNNDIVLNGPECEDEENCSDYVYAFMIYDKKSEILDAFGLYR